MRTPFLFVLSWWCAHAQGGSGAIAGRISDPGGKPVRGARVVAARIGSGQRRETTTALDGAYRVALLEPGEYRVEITADQFRPLVREPITVLIAETADVSVQLELGARSESIVVTGEAPPLRIESATLGYAFAGPQIVDLPLVTRNFTQLLALQPGAVGDLPNAGAFGLGSQGMSVSGSRLYDNSVLIEGVNAAGSITFGITGLGPGPLGGIAVPAPDAVQEFKVQTSLYSAEYGRAGGASVDLALRSGSNNVHGDAYEFLRNEALNANEFFFKRNEALNGLPNRRPLLRENQFGGTLGGPLRRDRTFVFGSYEGTRQLNGAAPGLVQSLNRYPLLPAERSDATALRQALGAIYGGRHGFPAGSYANGVAVNAILPNGANISPVAIQLLQAKLPNGQYLFPTFAPNGFNDGAGGLAGGAVYSNAAFSFPGRFDEDQYVVDLDHILTGRQTIGLSFFSSHEREALPSGNLPGFSEHFTPQHRNATVFHTFSAASWVNQLRAGFVRITNPGVESDPFDAATIGMKHAPGSTRLPIVFMATNGINVGSQQGYTREAENMYTVSDTFSRTWRRHAIRVGGSLVRHRLNSDTDLLKAGQLILFGFEDLLLGQSGAENGIGISNILSAAAETGSFEKSYRFDDRTLLVQDDWRVRHNLTLNLGLRYDWFAWPVEARGRLGNFDLSRVGEGPFGIPTGSQQYNGYTVPASLLDHYPGLTIPNGIAVVGDTTLNSSGTHNVAPRFGIAWQPATNWSVRGGYGLFYSRVNAEVSNAMAFGFPFNSLILTQAKSSGTLADPFSFLNLPPDTAFPVWSPRVYDPTSAASLLLAPIDPAIRNPYVQQWNVSVERQIGHSVLVEVAWIGSHGLRLINTRAANTPVIASPSRPIRGVTTNGTAAGDLQARSPYAGVLPDRGITLTTSDAESKYEALAVSAQRRFGRLQFLSAFTFGKAIDNNSLTPTGTTSNAQTPGDNTSLQQYGLSTFDRKARWVNSFVVRLRKGFEVAGIFAMQSGTPLTFLTSVTGSAVKLQGYLTPELQPGKTLADLEGHGEVSDRIDAYFASSALGQPGSLFVKPAPTSYGGLGRGLPIRAPGQATFDVALSRTFRVSERVSAQVRGELFNALNRVNFGAPATTVSAATFGTINSTTTAPRVVQLALKLVY